MKCKKCGHEIEFDMAGTGIKGEDAGSLDIQVQCSNEGCFAIHYTFIPASDLVLAEHAERLIEDYKQKNPSQSSRENPPKATAKQTKAALVTQARLQKRIELEVWSQSPGYHARIPGTAFKATATGSLQSAVTNLALRLWCGHNNRSQFNKQQQAIERGLIIRAAICPGRWEVSRP